MPTMPYPTNTDIAVQNNTTGQVDYLQFQGSTLVKSDAINYAGAGWNVVAQGSYGGPVGTDLVVQNQSTGFLDILKLDANGSLVGSVMSDVSVPRTVGEGDFTSLAPGQAGPTLVSQLANGELDMLGFDGSGTLIHSDAIANTVGCAQAVGVGESQNNFPLFAGIGTGGGSAGNDNVVLQLADGSLDTVGFSGDFNSGTLSASASMVLPGSAGLVPVQAINQQVGGNSLFFGNENIVGGTGTGGISLEGAQFVTQLANGTFDNVFADSGYGDAAHEGTIYASTQLNLAMPGWDAVSAGAVARELFPIT
jgi:hypothetical protein